MKSPYPLLSICAGLILVGAAAFAAVDEITLEDDATGGECTAVGTWTLGTKTCLLTQNLIDSNVVFEDSNITLDCDGYMIQGEQTGVNAGFTDIGVTLGTTGPPTRVTVKNCYIKNFCQAIRFEDSEYNRILNNYIEDIFRQGGPECGGSFSGAGVFIDDDYDLISGNVFSNIDAGEGLGMDFELRNGTDTQVINNKFLDCKTSNVINVRCGGTSTAGGTLIKRNLIQDEGRSLDGIEISDKECQDISIINNKILSLGFQDCIEIAGSRHKVLYNLCQFTADEAFEIATNDSFFIGNTLVHSTQEAVDDELCSAGNVTGNATIEFECGSGNEFIDNTIVSDGCGSGILFESRTCSGLIGEKNGNLFEGNRIYGNLFHGIFIRDPDATDNIIRNNKIYQNGLSGIKNDGINTDIEDNAIRKNGAWGIDNSVGSIDSLSGNKGKGGSNGFCTGCP